MMEEPLDNLSNSTAFKGILTDSPVYTNCNTFYSCVLYAKEIYLYMHAVYKERLKMGPDLNYTVAII
jgi:hypothetical protein